MSLAAITRPLENDLSLPHLVPAPGVPAQQTPRLDSRSKKRHPAALWVLSAAEGSERFGFFLMLTLFTLFLNERQGFSESKASDFYGDYLVALYATPFLGGFIARRFRSRLFFVMCGALTLAAGYFCLALLSRWALLVGLCVLALGTGFFKPNISVLLGSLYASDDERQDEAFGIFYLAANAGSMLGPLIGELLRHALGWRAAFAAAGMAPVASYVILRIGRRFLCITERTDSLKISSHPTRYGVRALLLLCMALIPFWMAYYQHGSSLTFWARDGIDRTVFVLGMPYEIPTGWFSASSALFVIVLTAPLAHLVRRLRFRSAEKVTVGMIFGAASFALLWLAARQSGGARIHPVWLLAHYLMMSIGELLLAPIGLSIVSKLAPPRWSGLLFGLFFATTAVGSWLAGGIGHLWVCWPHEQFFALLSIVLLLTAALLATQLGWLRRTMPR